MRRISIRHFVLILSSLFFTSSISADNVGSSNPIIRQCEWEKKQLEEKKEEEKRKAEEKKKQEEKKK